MNWFSKFKSRLEPDQSLSQTQPLDNKEAKDALASAKDALGKAQRQQVEVKKVTKALAELRERNHFAESIELALTTRRKHA